MSRRATPARRIARIAGWLAAVTACAMLLKYDIALMRWRNHVWPEGPEGLLKQVVHGLRDFAQIVPIAVALIIVATYDRRRRQIITVVVVAQLLAAVAYNSGKLLIGRYRPDADVAQLGDLSTATTGQTWAGWHPGNTDESAQSFPSGHSAAAFALAGVLGWFYPRLRWMLWALALGCATSRYLDGVHWPSDCAAGAVIGYLAAWLALRPSARRPRGDGAANA